MNILLYGYGKLGKVYAEKLSKFSCGLYILDPFVSSVSPQIYSSFEALPNISFHLVVICTSTGHHVSCIANHLFSNSIIFCEKPIIFGADESNSLSSLFTQDSSLKNRLFVSAPLRFSQPIQSIKNSISDTDYNQINSFFRFSHSTFKI